MNPVRKAIIRVDWLNQSPEDIPVMYNPTEFSLEKQAQFGEVAIPGLDSPLQQFVRGQAEKLSMELFFDTTEFGMGQGAVSVTTETDRIYQLIKIEPTRHAPPILTFIWADAFPGSSVGGSPGAGASAAGAASGLSAIGPSLGGQRRNGFRCVMESIRQKFTLFSPDGVPLRATLTVSLREYKTLNDQLEQLHLSSPNRTHLHVLQESESLAAVSRRYYDKPSLWRAIAQANAIDDPRRLRVGAFLRVPRIV
jgi:hypothetical protein